MNKFCTTIEQSKKLLELGIDVNTADMMHDRLIIIPFNDGSLIPAWSLAALYSVLPTFTLDSSDDKYFRIHCCKKFSEWYNNPVDAAFEMILKLHEQNINI